MNGLINKCKVFFLDTDSTDQVTSNALYLVGYMFLLMYSLMKISLYDYFKIIEPVFVLLGLYLFFKSKGLERNSVPVYLLFYSILVTLIVWVAGVIDHPELIHPSIKLEHLARHFVFIIGAYLLAGSSKKIDVYFVFSIIGLLMVPWTQGDGWNELVNGWKGQRIDFNIQNAQHTGVLFGVAFMGLIVLYKRFFNSSILKFLWLFLLLFTSFVVLSSQTRSVLLGLLVVATFLIFFVVSYQLKVRGRHLFTRSHFSYFLVFFLVLLILGFAASKTQFFSKSYDRLESEMYVFDKVLQGDFSEIPYTSMGARLNSWRAGAEWFLKRPVLGWGSNGGAIVNRNTEWLQGTVADSWGHMHSSYMETAVRYGLLGVSIYFILLVWFFRRLYMAWKHGVIPTDYYLFFVGFLVFWFFVNIFESYMYYWVGVYIFNLIMAPAVSYIWKDMKNIQKIKEQVA